MAKQISRGTWVFAVVFLCEVLKAKTHLVVSYTQRSFKGDFCDTAACEASLRHEVENAE